MENVSTLIFFGAMFFYLRNIVINKDFIPSPVGFGIWMVVDIINFITYSAFSQHWHAPAIMAGSVVFIFTISLIRSRKVKVSLDWLDYISITTAVVSLCYYKVTGNAELANALVQIVLVVGFVPIMRPLIKDRTVEPILPWTLFTIGWFVVLINTWVNPHTFIELSYPLFQGFIGCGVVTLLSWYNQKNPKKPSAFF